MSLKTRIVDLYQLDSRSRHALFFIAANYFLCLLSYEIIRAASGSLYIDQLGAKQLPKVWILSTVVIAVLVYIYNRMVNKWTFIDLLLGSTAFFFTNLLVFYLLFRFGYAEFGYAENNRFVSIAFYIWKDVHIVILVEQLWSLGNTLFPTEKAKGMYGLISAGGCIGALLGNLLTSAFSNSIGTVNLLLLACTAIGLAFILQLSRSRTLEPLTITRSEAEQHRQSCSKKGGIRLIVSSRYLTLLAAMLFLSQILTVLIDYLFNLAMESNYRNLDSRTGIFGNVFAIINGGAIVIQLLLNAPLLRHFGLLLCLLIYPAGITCGLSGVHLFPGLASVFFLKIFNKTIDYSIYRAAKELLYIPLSYEQKYKAKATIDMFLYRVAKGGASLTVMSLQTLVGTGLSALVFCCYPIVGLWFIVIFFLIRGYKELPR